MTFTSFSQNFEDVMMWRALKGVRGGFYIDVGAHDPTYGSVTKAFYDRGWRGINVEPIPTPFGLLQAARPRDVNLQVCAGAINSEIDIYDVSPSGLATTQLSVAEEYRSAGHSVTVRRVPVRTLGSICGEHVKGEIHFLKVDVEGAEKEVLLGADFARFRPWILVLEATYPNSPEENYSDWEKIVLDAGYRFAYFDGLNRFYVAVEHEDLHSCFDKPPNFFDGFALSSTCFFSRQVAAEVRQAETRATEAEARATQAEVRESEARAHAQQALTVVQHAQAQVTQAEARATEAEVRESEARAQAQQALTVVQHAQAQATQAEARATEAEARTTALLNSMSWRITTPMRNLSRLITNTILLPKHVARACLRMGAKVLPRTIAKVARIFLRYPILGYRISQWLQRYPALRQRLIGIVRRYSAIPETAQRVTQRRDVLTVADLNPRARHIYADIKTVIEKPSLVEGPESMATGSDVPPSKISTYKGGES